MIEMSQILGLIFFIIILTITIPWSVFFWKRWHKVIKLLETKYSDEYKLSFVNIYLLGFKLIFNLSSFPEEIQEIYKPIRLITLLGGILGIIVVVSFVIYIIIIT